MKLIELNCRMLDADKNKINLTVGINTQQIIAVYPEQEGENASIVMVDGKIFYVEASYRKVLNLIEENKWN